MSKRPQRSETKEPGPVAKMSSTMVHTQDSSSYGLDRWQQIRKQWLTPTHQVKKETEVIAKNIDTEDVIARIFSQSGNGALAEPIPLAQMIDLLIDFWEADGLFD